MVDPILCRAADGERISADEAVALYRDAPLADLGAAADAVTPRMYGDEVTYNVNAHLNPTNICVVGCGFCAFAVWTEKDPRAYAYSVDQLVDRALQLAELGITELHIVGGMTKEYDLEYYEELFRELKAAAPAHRPHGADRGRDRLRRPPVQGGSPRPWSARSRPATTRCPAAAPRSSAPACGGSSPTARSRPRPGWRCTGRPTAWACARTRRCCSATSRRPRSRWTTWRRSAPAGRDRRVPGVHPAAVPARQHRVRLPARADPRGEAPHDRHGPPLPRQLPAHQGPLGHARRGRSRPRRCRSASTTCPARSRRSASPTPRRWARRSA